MHMKMSVPEFQEWLAVQQEKQDREQFEAQADQMAREYEEGNDA